MNTKFRHIILLAATVLLFSSCYTYRYVPDGEHVLYHNELSVTMTDSSEVTPAVKEALKDVRTYYAQKPNTKLLGIKPLRVSMTIYGIASPKNKSFIGNYFRRLGQAPVVYESLKAERTVNQLNRLLQSKGCFNSEVYFDTLKMTEKNITIGYHIKASPRYHIDEVTYHTSDRRVDSLLHVWSGEALLHVGDAYDQELIAGERARIVSNLRESGYYHATSDLVTFVVDTTYSDSNLSIDVNVDSRDLRPYHINNIYIYPNSTGSSNYDTLIHTYRNPRGSVDFQYIYSEPMTISPKTISRAMMLFPGMTYRPRYINSTYNSLLSLHNFKYIDIDFSESPASNDTLALVDAHVRLLRSTQQRLTLSLELTNASPVGSLDSSQNFFLGGNLGAETSLEYQHKNLFGGAELLRVKGSLLLELPKLNTGDRSTLRGYFSAFEANTEITLDMPVFLIPFSSRLVWQRIKPHTLFAVSGSYQYRYYFERILANTSFGYSWSHSPRVSNQVLPIELTFVRMLSLDENFAARLQRVSDLRMKYQYSSHFIMDARYDYTFSNQVYGLRQNFTALHMSVESAGNILSAIGSIFNTPKDENNIRQIFGVPFSRYARLSGEWTRYWYFGTGSTFVHRLLVGIGLPYGNSFSMPYEKSFFGGGPTTMRAWQLRRLGPGSFPTGGDLLERVGDLQLVLNLEGRFPVVSIVEGALFADIGNVWLLNPSSTYTGGELKWNSLPSELAVGVGVGIRVNVSIATLRVDFGIPLYDPGFQDSLRWRPSHWAFSDIVTNFGINYPF